MFRWEQVERTAHLKVLHPGARQMLVQEIGELDLGFGE